MKPLTGKSIPAVGPTERDSAAERVPARTGGKPSRREELSNLRFAPVKAPRLCAEVTENGNQGGTTG